MPLVKVNNKQKNNNTANEIISNSSIGGINENDVLSSLDSVNNANNEEYNEQVQVYEEKKQLFNEESEINIYSEESSNSNSTKSVILQNLEINNNVQNNNNNANNNNNNLLALDKILLAAVKINASDVHLTPGYSVMFRVNGEITRINNKILSKEEVLNFVKHITKNRYNFKIDEIAEYDMSYQLDNFRFRVNIFKTMQNFSIVFRLIPNKIKDTSELNIPDIVSSFINFSNGLVLVTGPTGSGKSTTIASILNLINLNQSKHIITLEDPVEYVFEKRNSLIDQREFNIDFFDWKNALKSVLRQDPDIVFIGEMRDLDTIEAALQISETGHLVFSTLHTNSASQTIDRIINVFHDSKKDDIKIRLSNVIRAVISQKLIVINNGKRFPVFEILIANSAVKNSIRESMSAQIDNLIQTGNEYGMFSLEQNLVNLVKKNMITVNQAKTYANRKSEIDILLKQDFLY